MDSIPDSVSVHIYIQALKRLGPPPPLFLFYSVWSNKSVHRQISLWDDKNYVPHKSLCVCVCVCVAGTKERGGGGGTIQQYY